MSVIECPECHSENSFADETCRNCGASLPGDASNYADTDWLNDLTELIASVKSEESETLAPEGLPEWLEGEQAKEEETTAEVGEDILAWLREIRPMEAADAKQEESDDDLPDWLKRATSSIRQDSAAIPGEEPKDSAATSEPEDDEMGDAVAGQKEPTPDWVSELTASEKLPDLDDEAVPDWTAYQDDDEGIVEGPSPDLPMTQPLNQTKELRGVPRQIASESLPEWLSDQSVEPPAEMDFDDASLDWIEAATEQSIDDEEGDRDKDEAGQAISSMGQRAETTQSSSDEWLAPLGEAPARAEAGAELESGGLSPPEETGLGDADIPDWLVALKPGAPAGDGGLTSSMSIENSGPLAGVRGVIPVAPVVAGNPQSLQAQSYAQSKEQKEQIAILQQLTAASPAEHDASGVQTSGSIFTAARILLGGALLIFAIVGWMLPSLGVTLPLPADVPQAAREAHSTVNNASGQAALVAFEYTPALSGELDAVAITFLRHLADNGSPIVTVSQSAAGSAIARRAVAEVEGLRSRSLGFIPGEAIGLRQLADCMEASDGCLMLSNRPVDEALQSELEDVSLIIVLAGERDGLSNWIEQVGSRSDASMVAGVAQQLGPVAEPYHASEQLSGYLNGVPAAAAYEQRLRGNDAFAVEWLTSLTLVHWLVIAVLVVGTLYFGLLGLASSRFAKTET